MAPATPSKLFNEENFHFLLVCMKHMKEKPDFEVVAQEIGMKNKQQAYVHIFPFLRDSMSMLIDL